VEKPFVRVTLDAETPSQPWATLKFAAEGGRRVTLQLRWRDGKPVADLAVGGDSSDSGSWSYSMMDRLFRGTVEGEEWKAAKTEQAVVPSLMAITARLVRVGAEWEREPVRSADRMLGWITRKLSEVRHA
jgi:hypothetical protein